MKSRLIALLLSLTLCISLSVPALAMCKDERSSSYTDGLILLAPGAHSQFGSGKNTQFEPEQRANPFENVFSKTAVFPPPAIAETDL